MPQRRRQLGIEGLEHREMMAGDVTVTYKQLNSTLTITGGSGDNGVAIVGLAGKYLVTGLEQGGSQTTVNGVSRITYDKVKTLVIDLGDGSDALVISNTSFAFKGTIDLGDGDDFLGLGVFSNEGERYPGSLIREKIIDERIEPFLGPLTISKNVSIDLGEGENQLRAGDFTTSGQLKIVSGDDIDKIWLHDISAESFGLTTDQGDDEVLLQNLATKYDTAINTGADQDTLLFETFSGRKLSVNLSTGDDNVGLKNVTVSKFSQIDGGKGDNIYVDLGGNTSIKLLVWAHFETVLGTTAVPPVITKMKLAP